jgi:hypothetical protein
MEEGVVIFGFILLCYFASYELFGVFMIGGA